MTTPKLAVDYTNKDYNALRQALLDLARYRLPEWTDQSTSDSGTLFIDLFAYMGDMLLYYQDRIAAESFLPTATDRRSIQNLLRLVGYELSAPTTASADLTLIFRAAAPGQPTIATVPQGAVFATKPTAGSGTSPIPFVYLGADLTVDLTSSQVRLQADGRRIYDGLPVLQGEWVVARLLGGSTGEANQRFRIPDPAPVLDTIVVEVNEGAGWVRWERRDGFLFDFDAGGTITSSGADGRVYTVEYDAQDYASIGFGDNVFGMRPPIGASNIRASYVRTRGAAGNAPTGTIVDAKTTISQLESVTNLQAAGGGADQESGENAARYAPGVFRAGQRAVTLSDYVTLARQAGGVARVRARSAGWNEVELFIAPSGDEARGVPEALKKRLLTYFEERRMAGTWVTIRDPVRTPIDVQLTVVSDPRYAPDAVRQAAESAVRGLLSFTNVDFGETLYLSQFYSTVEAVAGVTGLTITRFRRRDATAHNERALQDLNLALPLGSLPDFITRALYAEIAVDGRIVLGDVEIAIPGEITVSLTGAGVL